MAEDNKPQMDFSSLDQLMMMLLFGAANSVDKSWPVEKQAEAIAKFYARFLDLRAAHESDHVTKQGLLCPFCMSLKLSLALNREKTK